MRAEGIVAAGHPRTAEAARLVLREGGNAFDAALAGACVAMLAEPVLASLGGGGFLLARPAAGPARVFDFFAQTPKTPLPAGELDFQPILADFGTVTQEFHIGMGSVATPGMVKGLFAIHRALGRMPMRRLLEPAIEAAREGIPVNAFHGYVFEIIAPIYGHTADSLAQFASPGHAGALVGEGDLLRIPDLADTLEALAREGEELFYQGDIARLIVRACRGHGGCLTQRDLSAYRVEQREPLRVDYRGSRVLINPPPSCGGLLIAFALHLLRDQELSAMGFGSRKHLSALARAMAATNAARTDHLLGDAACADMQSRLFDPGQLDQYRQLMRERSPAHRGTTHLGVIDRDGNVASMTVSNGEGCGHILPGTGIMLNNMLGEEDLNPGGFHRWQPDRRLSSMMSPALLLQEDGTVVATGSGGSNRIRTAILQVLINLIDFAMPVQDAVYGPRIHHEGNLLNVEGGYDRQVVEALIRDFAHAKVWEERNLFFGGAHTVGYSPSGRVFDGAGDPRRAGACVKA